jgi:hypothetical protein
MYGFDLGSRVWNNWLNLAKTEEDKILYFVIGFCSWSELIGFFLP